jgi:hypothetical protein
MAFLLGAIPIAGCLAYIIVEIMPDLARGRSARTIASDVAKVLDPGRKIRDLEESLELSPTVANRTALAAAWTEKGEHRSAADLYQQCLEGIYKNDRHLLIELGRALHLAGDDARARAILDTVARDHGGFSDARDLLCYAVTLDAAGDLAGADRAYKKAMEKATGLEAPYRYALLLERTARVDEAARLLRSIPKTYKALPSFVRRTERGWLEAAKKKLDLISA